MKNKKLKRHKNAVQQPEDVPAAKDMHPLLKSAAIIAGLMLFACCLWGYSDYQVSQFTDAIAPAIKSKLGLERDAFRVTGIGDCAVVVIPQQEEVCRAVAGQQIDRFTSATGYHNLGCDLIVKVRRQGNDPDCNPSSATLRASFAGRPRLRYIRGERMNDYSLDTLISATAPDYVGLSPDNKSTVRVFEAVIKQALNSDD